MKLFIDPASPRQIQWFLWLAVLFIFFFAMLPQDGFSSALTFTLINVSFYAVVIYGNVNYLFPKFFETGRKIAYCVYTFIFIVGLSILRCYAAINIEKKYFSISEQVNWITMTNFIIAGLLIYLLSFIFRMAMAYLSIKQQSVKMMAQKSEAELNLLKSQVQPHFLFNTLNNIYYETYRDAPLGASLIAKLAEIMRYFVDESPKNEVDITAEINFLENYIALEKIRIKHPIALSFIKNFNTDIRIPPMLLMAFVENIFKHGIDKLASENKIEISLVQHDNFLEFTTRNLVIDDDYSNEPTGFGLVNLRKRLSLIYGNSFEMHTVREKEYFTAALKFPFETW